MTTAPADLPVRAVSTPSLLRLVQGSMAAGGPAWDVPALERALGDGPHVLVPYAWRSSGNGVRHYACKARLRVRPDARWTGSQWTSAELDLPPAVFNGLTSLSAPQLHVLVRVLLAEGGPAYAAYLAATGAPEAPAFA